MLVDKFIQYIKEERRFSPHTVNAYSKDLKQFGSFLEMQYHITEISEAGYNHIRSWLVALINEGDTSKTINRKLSTLKSFFRYCKANGFVENNPASRIPGPRTPRALPVFIEEKKMAELIHSASDNSFEHIRDSFVLHLLYVTGMRRAELLRLKFENFNTGNSTISITGKRNKERIVPVSTMTIELYRKYVEQRMKITPMPDCENLVFISKIGKPVNARVLYRIINAMLKEVSTQQHLGPHTLRHSFATHMLDNGADLNAIKEILGHQSLAATQVYTHNTVEKLKKIYKQAHPRA